MDITRRGVIRPWTCQTRWVACVSIRPEKRRRVLPGRLGRPTDGLLLRCGRWLSECRCTHVAMEATEFYGRRSGGHQPRWADFELIVANAAHIKNVPGGRKTDMKRAMWLADLLAFGLMIKASLSSDRSDAWFAFADAHPQAAGARANAACAADKKTLAEPTSGAMR